jgi:hypothetical protein
MTRLLTIIIHLAILSGGLVQAQAPDFCITSEEYRLYTLVNNYRQKQGLNVVPISASMCYVAKIHARDLFINNPDTSDCSLNSWSDKGEWTACCHSGQTPNPACIVNKPKELADYPGEGHELAYWDSQELNPDTILHFWQSIEQANDIILNRNKWSYFNWKAMGIGLYKGYACMWVGEVADTIPEPSICDDAPDSDYLTFPVGGMKDQIVRKPTGRSYIIYGSFNSMEDAAKMLEIHKRAGFSGAKILTSDKNFRVSLADYPTQQEALAAKKKLGMEYKEAWVTKF